MRIVELTDESKNNILENLLKRSPNSYGKFESAVAEILLNIKTKGDEALFEYTKNFDKKRVDIFFSEFVQLKEVSEKFVFSPPLKKNPKVSLRGKYVQVSIPDTLRPNTTYSMDFADAIVDNNEGNPLGYYRYVFSTGDIIDTLEVSGNVVNAESYEPMMNILVGLYEDQADSVPLLQLPDYIARTDSAGFFRLTNLRQAHYRVMAIDHKNKDKKYAP